MKCRCFRNLWENIRAEMPKKGRGKAGTLDPLELPTAAANGARSPLRPLREDLQALAGDGHQGAALLHHRLPEHSHLEARLRFRLWLPSQANEDGTTTLENGRLALFRNFDETTGNPLPRPNTLLIDSEQLEAGDALDDNFRSMAADEIDRFRREIVERTGDIRAAKTSPTKNCSARS